VLDQKTLDVQANGIRIAYRVIGPPSATPMVLLHGMRSSGPGWRGVAETFAETHRVYLPDLRGHGASEWPGEYSFESMRDDVHGFLDVLGLEDVVLVGHSLGGTVALLVAEQYPDRVTRLVLEDSPPPTGGGPRFAAEARPDGELDYAWPMVESVYAQLNEPDPAWMDRAVEVKAAALVLAGGSSSFVPQHLIADLAARIPDCVMQTIPVGHQIHRDRPEEFIAAVRGFLAGKAL
jgi:3-oxoadipate enol-lactonase